jgi:primase-polymerase (primpol)-like protein
MATIMHPEPEYTRHERFIQYAETLKERFASGVLAELQDLDQWVVWRAELEESKSKKVPYNPHYYDIHAKASVNIPKSWGTLDQALTALASGHYSGLGFVLTPPLVMIDLDHSVDRATGTITDPTAQEIVQEVNSYTETSPSGTGLHILSYGQLPGKGIHTAVEIYGQQRFTTITTHHFPGTPTTIEHRTDQVAALYHRFAPPVEQTNIQNTRGGVVSGNELSELPPEAEHDAVLQRLLSGDLAGYKSQSSADFVLIMKLLHWTGDNVELTRSIFLSSPLGQREKAQRKTGQTTYVDMTITNVVKKRRNPPQKR